MHDVTAEMIERGREGDPVRATQKRRLAVRIREAREKLTSSGSGQRAFDVALLRVFAERHKGASPALSLLALAVAAIASLWASLTDVLIWLSILCCAIILLSIWVNGFLADKDPGAHLVRWQRRFAMGEALRGMAWALLAALLLGVRDPAAQTFVLMVLLTVGATTAMLSASVPVSVYASLLPITAAIAIFMPPASNMVMPLLTISASFSA